MGCYLVCAMPEGSDSLIERARLAQREHSRADARQQWLAAIDLLRRDDAREPLATALRALGELERKLHDADGAKPANSTHLRRWMSGSWSARRNGPSLAREDAP